MTLQNCKPTSSLPSPLTTHPTIKAPPFLQSKHPRTRQLPHHKCAYTTSTPTQIPVLQPQANNLPAVHLPPPSRSLQSKARQSTLQAPANLFLPLPKVKACIPKYVRNLSGRSQPRRTLGASDPLFSTRICRSKVRSVHFFYFPFIGLALRTQHVICTSGFRSFVAPPLPSPALPWQTKEGSVWNEIFKKSFSDGARNGDVDSLLYFTDLLKAPVHTIR